MSENLLLTSALLAWDRWYTAALLYWRAITPETRQQRRERALRLGSEYILAARGLSDPGIRWGIGEVEIASAAMVAM